MKKRRLRILWSSNAPWVSTGYGTQTKEIVYRLHRAGYPIAVSAFAGHFGAPINLGGVINYGVFKHRWGSDAMHLHQQHFQADVVFAFQDVFTCAPNDLAKVKNFIAYVPIDREPVPPGVLQNLNHAWQIATYSKFGQKALEKEGYASEMIYHGVDTDVYKPLDKKEMKKSLGLDPERFLFGMVSANKDNPPRKSFQEVLDAFKEFLVHHPNSDMWFHTELQQEGGFPIASYAQKLGIFDHIKYMDSYQMVHVDKVAMAGLYNAFDCLLCPSFSEGFGLPIIEAQACGVPVIVNDFSSMPELILPNKTGYKTKVLYKRFDAQMAYVGTPDPEDLLDKMYKVRNNEVKNMGKNAREHAVKNFDMQMLIETKWIPYLEKIETKLYGSPYEEVAAPTATIDSISNNPSEDPIVQALKKTKEELGDSMNLQISES